MIKLKRGKRVEGIFEGVVMTESCSISCVDNETGAKIFEESGRVIGEE